ncbi:MULTISPECIES: ATP-grasp domain-containing protein [unclassified Yoonia]|uniref:ATP-grasp domain-containing protein n=1 Tax=unclassified Yoonia TaxID=2629118 RepID=UPI002AFDDB5F|nr:MULTISPECIES: ATP-grasp domain-containing protein [unclassified Yoonia]
MRVLITGARAPVALHLLRLLAGAGHEVHLADSLRQPLSAASVLHQGCHLLPSLRAEMGAAAEALQRLLRDQRIDYVIPTCEEVLYLGQIWRDHPMPAPLFAPSFELLEQVHNKHRFIMLCEALGLPAPRTRLLQSKADVTALVPEAQALVFKPVWSRFATQTMIRPARLDRIAPSPAAPWVAQDFIAGQELCVYAVAHAGKVTALSAYRGLIRAGLGASVCFAAVQDAGVTDFVTRFVAGTGWTGQISFDLIRRDDGTVLPIECNPRATSGLHFFRDPAPIAAAISGKGTAVPDVTQPQGVPLAVWLYGLPQVMRKGGWQALRHARATVGDVMDWPGDRFGIAKQLRPLAEIARIALRDRVSLQKAATRDIEWDGPDQRSI